MNFIFKAPCQIVVCGDSISAGVVFDESADRYVKLRDSFVGLLQNSLDGVVTNISRFGNTIATAIPRLRKNLEKQKPDIVLIELGGNDCDYDWEQIALNPAAEHHPATDIETFKARLAEIIKALRQKGIAPVLTTLPPIDPERYFLWISRQSSEKAARILEWLGSVSRIYWWQERYNAAVLKVAESTHSAWIDLRSAFLSLPDFRRLLCKDGIHPNSEGHRLICETIKAYILSNCPALIKNAAAMA